MNAQRNSITGVAKDRPRAIRSACGYALAGVLAFGPLGIISVARAGEVPPAQPVMSADAAAQKASAADHRALNRYLSHNPRVAHQLNNNPDLVNDPGFLAKHSHLQKLLAKHPQLQAELKENPRLVVKHTGKHSHTATQSHPTANKKEKGS